MPYTRTHSLYRHTNTVLQHSPEFIQLFCWFHWIKEKNQGISLRASWPTKRKFTLKIKHKIFSPSLHFSIFSCLFSLVGLRTIRDAVMLGVDHWGQLRQVQGHSGRKEGRGSTYFLHWSCPETYLCLRVYLWPLVLKVDTPQIRVEWPSIKSMEIKPSLELLI